VNLASRLEAATKQFGIPILVSDNLYNICSLKIQNFLRKIDCVTVKGSKVPMELYTFDGDFEILNIKKAKPKKKFKNAFEKKRYKVAVTSCSSAKSGRTFWPKSSTGRSRSTGCAKTRRKSS